MSRSRNRNSNRTKKSAPDLPAQKKNPLTRDQKLKELLMALDGYSNAAAFLGEASPLLSSGTFRRSDLTSQTELLTVTYRESWLAKGIALYRQGTAPYGNRGGKLLGRQRTGTYLG